MESPLSILMSIFVVSFLFLLGFIMPSVTRKRVVFAVHFPESFANGPQINALQKKYKMMYLIAGGPLALACIVFLVVVSYPAILPLFVFVQLGVIFSLFFIFRKRAQAIKQSMHPAEGFKEIAIADTASGQMKGRVFWLWFIAPLLLVAFNFFVGIWFYDSAPARFPIHFDTGGNPDGWANKSFLSVFYLPIVMMFVSSIFLFVFYVIHSSKREICVENPKASVVQNRIFRKRWSGFVISSSIVLLAVMTLTYLRMLAVAQISATVLAICWVVAIGYLIGYSGILAWKTGQGGSRISMGQSDGRKKVINRDDDHFWKAGLFYFNPDDPAVFVEKRYGVGFTMNFARRKAILVAVGILVLVLMLVVLSIVISTREF